VMTAGYADPLSAYGYLSPDGSSYDLPLMETVPPHNMGVTPWENPERYVENSPMFHLDRVQTPLLIAHGSNDHAVPSYLGDQVFVGLRRLGKRVEYVKYEQEGHTPATWSYQHRVDFHTRVVNWFEHYLNSGPSEANLPSSAYPN
jgi:dipeptidyl aminopeptidase/acylaminoacyl peptidase